MKEHTKKIVEKFGELSLVSIIGLALITGLASAALLNSFGEITGEADVDQAVYLEDAAGDAVTDEDTIQASYDTEFVAGQTFTDHYTLVNDAPTAATVEVESDEVTNGVDVEVSTAHEDVYEYDDRESRIAVLELEEPTPLENLEDEIEISGEFEEVEGDAFAPYLNFYEDESDLEDSSEVRDNSVEAYMNNRFSNESFSYEFMTDTDTIRGLNSDHYSDPSEFFDQEGEGHDMEVTHIEVRAQGAGDTEYAEVTVDDLEVQGETIDLELNQGTFTIASGLELDFTHEADFDIALEPQEYPVETTVYPESEAP